MPGRPCCLLSFPSTLFRTLFAVYLLCVEFIQYYTPQHTTRPSVTVHRAVAVILAKDFQCTCNCTLKAVQNTRCVKWIVSGVFEGVLWVHIHSTRIAQGQGRVHTGFCGPCFSANGSNLATRPRNRKHVTLKQSNTANLHVHHSGAASTRTSMATFNA